MYAIKKKKAVFTALCDYLFKIYLTNFLFKAVNKWHNGLAGHRAKI